MSASAPSGFRGIWREDLDARAAYSEAAGIGRILPRAVARPSSVDDVVAIMEWARDTHVPLIPRGSGSSMAGGAIGDGVVLDLGALQQLGAVDRESRRIAAQPGVVRDAVDAAARRAQLRLPVNPSSGAFCTIGGMAATNASGPHSLKHGSIRRWITALDCVFADGSRATVRRGEVPRDVEPLHRARRLAGPVPGEGVAVRKNSSGYAGGADLLDLLVGSEGTLGVFVGIELALTDVPGATSSVLAAFPTLASAAAGAAIARESGAAACELLDRTFIDIAREGGAAIAASIPAAMEAVLLMEIEAPDEGAARHDAAALAARLDEAGAALTSVALTTDDEHRLWTLRHAASPILARLDPALKSMQFIEDGVVPPERLADYIIGVRAALDRAGLRGVIFGHAGDAHVHVNPLIDVRRPDWRTRMESLFDDVCALTVALGGTLSGEHGDGRLRAPLLGTVLGDRAAEWARDVKRAFDPDGILNPGAKVPIPGQRCIDQVKYDPSLPPLPPRAARALDVVAETRAYARSRLELLDEATATPTRSVARSDPAD